MSEITKKFSAVVLTLALALSVTVTGFAAEPTVADLQAQIAELQALIAQLKADLGGGTVVVPSGDVPAACAGVSFNRNISLGATGSDVKCLQAILNTDADTQVAAAGAGSKGLETEYFGGLTRAAVIKYQNKHAAEVLTPLGLTAGTGIVGVQTRAKLNASMAGGTVTPDEPGTTPSTPSGEEGYLKAKILPVPTGVDVAWGASNVAVMAFEVEAKDSEIRIERVDLNLSASSGEDYRIWRYIDHIALYDGDNAIKGVEINTSNADKLDQETSRVRISGLNINVPKGTKKTLTVKVSVGYNPLGAGKNVLVTIPINGIRGIDGAGIDQYAPAVAIAKSFEVEGSETGAKIELKVNANSPKESYGITDKDDYTKHELFRVDFDVTKKNVKIEDLKFNLLTTTGTEITTAATLADISSFRLYDGGTLIGNEVGYTTSSKSYVYFQDLDLNVNSGSTKTLILEVEMKKASTIITTAGLKIGLNATGVSAIVEDDNSNVTVNKDITSEAIHFFAAVPEISNIKVDKPVQTSTTGKEYSATIEFDIKAKGGDVTITTVTPTTTPNSGATAATSVTIDGDTFSATVIKKGEKKTIVARGILTVSASAKWVVFKVGSIGFNVVDPAQSTNTVPLEFLKELKTQEVYIKS